MYMQINSRELREKLSDYLRLVQQGQRIEVTRHNRVIARLLPPETTPLDIEDLEAFHNSLEIRKKLPNAVLAAREAAER
jgi:prevent-host-death family protein